MLGSVFADAPCGPSRGPDLWASVDVPDDPRQWSGGVVVRVPLRLEDSDGLIRERQRDQDLDEGGHLRVHLGADTQAAGALRLRGMGARRSEEEAPGDLLLRLRFVPMGPPVTAPPSAETGSLWWLVGAAAAVVLLARLCTG